MMGVVFPGQGSQTIGMGKEIYENFPLTHALFQEAEDLFSQHLRTMMFHGPEEHLRETTITQPAIFLVSMAIITVLHQEFGVNMGIFSGAAGHSLGEYSALCATGALSFQDTLRLIKVRCASMAHVRGGGMTAIIGMGTEEVMQVLHDMGTLYGFCQIANDNAPGQVVLSGEIAALEEASRRAKAAGAHRCVSLSVSGPFHSSLMKPAADTFAMEAHQVHFSAPHPWIYTNVSATPTGDAERLRQDLIHQISQGVRWRETQLNWHTRGLTTLVEIGGTGVLAGLARKTIPDVVTHWVHNLESLTALVTLLQSTAIHDH